MTINNMNPVRVHLDETDQFQPSFAERNPLLRTVKIIAEITFAAVLLVPLAVLAAPFYIISRINGIEEYNDFDLLSQADAVLINPPDLDNPPLATVYEGAQDQESLNTIIEIATAEPPLHPFIAHPSFEDLTF